MAEEETNWRMLVNNMRARIPGADEAFVREVKPIAFAVAIRRLPEFSRQDWEDVVIQALEKLLRKLIKGSLNWNRHQNFKGLISKIVKEQAFDFRRKKKREPFVYTDEIPEGFVEPDDQEHLDVFRECMRGLSEKEAEIIWRKLECAIQNRSLAERLELTMSNYYQTRKRAIDRVKECIENKLRAA